MPLQDHICSPSAPPPCCHPALPGSHSRCCGSASCKSLLPLAVRKARPETASTAAYHEEKTTVTDLILSQMAMSFDCFSWIQSGESENATAAQIQIQGSYKGWCHPKSLNRHQLCLLLSVRCLWGCLQLSKCLWSAVEEEMQSPDLQSCLGRERPVQSAKCWVLSVSSTTSRNQGHTAQGLAVLGLWEGIFYSVAFEI